MVVNIGAKKSIPLNVFTVCLTVYFLVLSILILKPSRVFSAMAEAIGAPLTVVILLAAVCALLTPVFLLVRDLRSAYQRRTDGGNICLFAIFVLVFGGLSSMVLWGAEGINSVLGVGMPVVYTFGGVLEAGAGYVGSLWWTMVRGETT